MKKILFLLILVSLAQDSFAQKDTATITALTNIQTSIEKNNASLKDTLARSIKVLGDSLIRLSRHDSVLIVDSSALALAHKNEKQMYDRTIANCTVRCGWAKFRFAVMMILMLGIWYF